MTDLAGLDATPWEYVARHFEPKIRTYPTPGSLARTLDRTTGTSPALDLIDRELVSLTDGAGDNDALMVLMPPQEGKSQRASRRYPEWRLEEDQTLRIAIVSYELEMALRWGRDIKQDIALHPDMLPISIRRDSTAAGRWETPQGGGVYCVGIGGPLTGRPVDLLIIDDPVKDRAAAESDKLRDVAWDWWESVALTRLAPGGKVVLIQTRWHEDDLAGRILSRPGPLRWKVIKIPAIAEEDDPLGREPGVELRSVRGRAPGHFYNLRRGLSPYVFSGVFQQTPTAPEGNFFRRATFRYWRPAEPWPDGRQRIETEAGPVTLADCWIFATVDVAASVKTSADYTVIAVWAITVSGDLLLLDRARDRVPEHDHFKLAVPLRDRWHFQVLYIEKGYFATTLIDDARAAGWPVAPLSADTDKVTRAIPAAGRLHAGRVYFPAETSCSLCRHPPGCGCEHTCLPWLNSWCDELAAFPKATHDDQVDTLSYAARVQSHEWAPPKSLPRPGLNPAEQAIEMARAAATGHAGNGHGGDLDIMNLAY
jgi:phage terminase large subunit-like protein